MSEGVIEFYYNPNVPCTCGAIFADTHRGYCKRRNKSSAEEWLKELAGQKLSHIDMTVRLIIEIIKPLYLRLKKKYGKKL